MIAAQTKVKVITALEELYNQPYSEKDFQLNLTKPEFEGDYTIVLFSLVKSLKLSPDAIGNQLGGSLLEKHPEIFTAYNIIKGFLNLTVSDAYWITLLQDEYKNVEFGK